jgi:hypothetical protein
MPPTTGTSSTFFLSYWATMAVRTSFALMGASSMVVAGPDGTGAAVAGGVECASMEDAAGAASRTGSVSST